MNRKPKTKRAKRFLEKREPKLSENIKNAMLIKGGNANSTVTEVLKDVVCIYTYFLNGIDVILGNFQHTEINT